MQLALDKWKHLLGGALLAGVASAVAMAMAAGKPMALTAQIAALLAGVLWELWQRYKGRGTPEAQDAAATAAGGSVVAVGLAWGTPAAAWYAAAGAVLVAWVLRAAVAQKRRSQSLGEIDGGGRPIEPPR